MGRWLFLAAIVLTGCAGDEGQAPDTAGGGSLGAAGTAGSATFDQDSGSGGQSSGLGGSGSSATGGASPTGGRPQTGGTLAGRGGTGSGGAVTDPCPDPCLYQYDSGNAFGSICAIECRAGSTTTLLAQYACADLYRQTADVQAMAASAPDC